MDVRNYDVVVIGAGPGGYPCAIRLAQLGKRVAVIEEGPLGGVCLNVGCIPSKAIISAMRRYNHFAHSEIMGIKAEKLTLDMAATQKWKSGVVTKLTGGIKQLLTANGVEIIQGRAHLTAANRIQVKGAAGEIEIATQDVVIATGSKPIELPAFPIDGKSVLGSAEVLALTHVPKRVVVLGGGYIGLELGSALRLAGSQVTVVEMASQLLAGFDTDAVQVVARKLAAMGVEIRLGTKAEAIVKQKNTPALKVKGAKGEELLPFDALCVTVGRVPRGQELALTRFGVKVDGKGFIQVDHQLRTNHPHIYAIGDVAGQPMLAHKATRDAEVCAEVIAGHTKVSIQNKVIPAVVFCEPELASAGLTEAEATAQGRKVKSARFPFAALGRALAAAESEGFAKIVFDAQSELVLGVHIVGAHATDLISEAALAIEMGATLQDISLTIHPHPTLGEALFEASKVGLGEAVHVMPAAPRAC